MWKGKYDALERTCKTMETEISRLKESLCTQYQPAVADRNPFTRGNHLHNASFNAALRRRSSFSLGVGGGTAGASGVRGNDSPALSAMRSPSMRPQTILQSSARVASQGVVGRASGHDGRELGQREGEGASDRSMSPLDPSSRGRSPSQLFCEDGLARGSCADAGDVEEGSAAERDAATEEADSLLDSVVVFGVSARTAYLMWLDTHGGGETWGGDVRCGVGRGGGEGDVVTCLPELLWSYPRRPYVQNLEEFVFPHRVPVQVERSEDWRQLFARQGPADDASLTGD